jgi:hypothetical protein
VFMALQNVRKDFLLVPLERQHPINVIQHSLNKGQCTVYS